MVEDTQKRYADDVTVQELVRLRVENEQLREALQWIAGCEGGDLFDLWKEMHDTARAALKEDKAE
jgi:hypothetical protein